MNVYLVQSDIFPNDVLQNLLILLKKNRGVAKFSSLDTSLNLSNDELLLRCIPCQKLQKKFLLSRNLLKEITNILPKLGKEGQYFQPETCADNSWYARVMQGVNYDNLPELKRYTLEDLINAMLRVSFLKHSFPLPTRPTKGSSVEPEKQHDLYTVSQYLFKKCKELRTTYNYKEEDYVVLFTKSNLDSNWIYTLDPSYQNNIIINVCPLANIHLNELPTVLAYYLITGILAKQSFRSFIDWYLHQHPHPENCIMDFNEDHANELQRIRTVSICRHCQPLINEDTVSPSLFLQLNNILESLKVELKGL